MPESTKAVQVDGPSTSIFKAICHPLVEEAVQDVDGFYLKHWKFESNKAKAKFVAAGFSRVSCLYFPKGRNDRIRHVCSLLTILFLIDDELEHMSLQDGQRYNESLMPLCAGATLPDPSVPVQWIMFDLWKRMRACDLELTDQALEPMFIFMKAQTSRDRFSITSFDQYLEYRQGDVGQAYEPTIFFDKGSLTRHVSLLAALTRFSMGLRISSEDLRSVAEVEKNCGRHISIVNDIYSYEKEVVAARNAHEEGGRLCNGVQILALEAGLDVAASKQILWSICREWEHTHEELVSRRKATSCGPELCAYMEGLEFHMSGNEFWSRETKRYHDVKA